MGRTSLPLRLSLFAAFILASQGGADAAPTLAEAVREADAKYRDAPAIAGDDSAPKIEAGRRRGGDRAHDTGNRARADQGGAELRRRDGRGRRGHAHAGRHRLRREQGGRQAQRREHRLRHPPVGVQIAELDGGNPYPEVVVSFYTGGAHCCSATSVLTASPDGSKWTTVDLGQFDGGPLLATDLNRDGRYEFMIRDNVFLYAFACYACSEAPLKLLAIDNGTVKDVTGDARFAPAHAAWLKTMIENVPEEGSDVNGFLAGYVGEKILLGEGKQGWDLMLAHYDRESDWGLEICDKPLDENGECPVETLKLTFPDALERMLKENGYKVEK